MAIYTQAAPKQTDNNTHTHTPSQLTWCSQPRTHAQHACRPHTTPPAQPEPAASLPPAEGCSGVRPSARQRQHQAPDTHAVHALCTRQHRLQRLGGGCSRPVARRPFQRAAGGMHLCHACLQLPAFSSEREGRATRTHEQQACAAQCHAHARSVGSHQQPHKIACSAPAAPPEGANPAPRYAPHALARRPALPCMAHTARPTSPNTPRIGSAAAGRGAGTLLRPEPSPRCATQRNTALPTPPPRRLLARVVRQRLLRRRGGSGGGCRLLPGH